MVFRSWRKKQALELLRENPAGLTTKDMAKSLSVKVKNIGRLLTRWTLRGIVSREPRPTGGRPAFIYKITPVGRARLAYYKKRGW